MIAHLGCFFPAYNEAENIEPLLDEAIEALSTMADRFDIVVVDDGSQDETAAVVERYAVDHPQVRLVRHPSNLGYGHALRTGLERTTGDAVALVDGDRQFRIADLSRLLAHVGEADIVAGYRIERADPAYRLLIARIYHAVLAGVFGLRVRDVDCGFKVFSRTVVDDLTPRLESRSAFISPELLIRAKLAGYTIAEVGVPHHPRTAGRSKGATPRVIARTLGEITRLRRSLGLRGRG